MVRRSHLEVREVLGPCSKEKEPKGVIGEGQALIEVVVARSVPDTGGRNLTDGKKERFGEGPGREHVAEFT